MRVPSTFLVFGGTGGTGRHFISLALEQGHIVRAVVRDPNRVAPNLKSNPNLQVHQGSVASTIPDLDEIMHGTDCVVAMLGDREAQNKAKINTPFVRDQLVPSMRRNGVKRFLYQAGGFSKPYGSQLPPLLWIMRHTLAISYAGQHADNDAVMEYLGTKAMDIEWISHRAGIGGDGPSKGRLQRSATKVSVGTFIDCAEYNLRVLSDPEAIHTCHTSYYA
jgi:uncharacterized protein